MEKFLKNSGKFVRNPLGIIALFISLIYGFASLVITVGGKTLEHNERIPIIYFLILFPVIVLGAFLWLVVKHHKKLYAPSDYRDDKSFLETIDRDNYNKKLKNEYEEMMQAEELLNSEKYSKMTRLDMQTIQFDDFKKKYLLVENLALNYIERLYSLPVYRNVRIKGIRQFIFDGILVKEDEVIIIEVKFIKDLKRLDLIARQLLNRMVEQLASYKTRRLLERNLKLLLFVVYEQLDGSLDIDKILQEMKTRLKREDIEIDIILMNFDKLKEEF